jgi:predicted oxidoreductase
MARTPSWSAAGPAGLATALEAARGGARIVVIDVASVFGGHAVVSEGGLSFADTPLQRFPRVQRFARADGRRHRAARRIARPAFHAVEVWPLTRKSMGGVAIDMECRALDAADRPIAGLYAVGEVAGFGGLNGKASIEGAFIAPAMLQRRMVGRAIAASAGRAPLATIASSRGSPPAAAAAVAPCATCHEMGVLLAHPRQGYWHFERVHGESAI